MLTLNQVLKAAKAWGYKGSESDETAVRSFVADCIDKGAKFNVGDGKYATRALVVEQPSPSQVIVSESVEAPAAMPEVTADPDAGRKYTATAEQRIGHLEATMRKLDATVAGGRPGAVTDGGVKELTVRSQSEIVFDQRKRQGLNVFSDYQTAAAWHASCIDYLAGHKNPDVAREVGPELRKRNAEKLAKFGVIDRDGYVKRTYATFPAGAGGALTHESFSPDLIKNINTYGICRQLAKYTPMADETVKVPKHNGGFLTLRYPDENSASTSQRNTYSIETLTAKTGVIAIKMSRQIVQDSRIDLALDLADDTTRAVARQEDLAYISGDGTSTYANMVGIIPRFTTIGITSAAGMVAGGTTTATHTMAHLSQVMAKAQDYARGPGACWLTSYANQASLFDRLFFGLGGVPFRESTIYGYTPTAFGFPIVCTNTMNATSESGANTVDALFGDFAKASMIGDRMGLEIETSNEVGFLDNAIWIRGVIRHDINVHDVGTTAVAGPIVGLYQTA